MYKMLLCGRYNVLIRTWNTMIGKEKEIPVEELDFGILRRLYLFLYTWCASTIKFHICKENWVSFMTESRNYMFSYGLMDPAP